ncbi:ABC transporter ATP-binding protein [Aestuariirhabdus sp. Z084]|uniref:ABC transporter ATP-binding protein n=1 Tax=Aestuariirhabdus haliotis TaxID=2918751 RepID=UPI00201B42A9|nr:ABC transporter ATP-binding protein [Aestuariirhabdus haliotis]MCL6414429.1 ABC transporter ATP-binding protein [Aestuariirhabdus haliotis]MCL6418589.1 ABC transporter ATP-binding protein [Aestuariirhabdus haliotis]
MTKKQGDYPWAIYSQGPLLSYFQSLPVTTEQGTPVIVKTRQLSKKFSQPILQAVDLEITAGETVLLLGESGSGKSTLLNLLAGLQLADNGNIWIADQQLDRMNDHQRTLLRRRHIGFIYQHYNLIPTLTVAENLRLPLQLNRLAGQENRPAELLDAVGLSNACHRMPGSLSGGEQQRVAICRALIHRPDLVLADEPTGSLDNVTARAVTRLMFEQIRAMKQTLLIVSHNEALRDQVDKSYRLHDGKLVQLP